MSGESGRAGRCEGAHTARKMCIRVTDGMGREGRSAYLGDGVSALCSKFFEDVVRPSAA